MPEWKRVRKARASNLKKEKAVKYMQLSVINDSI
jgi:hypothetical protein